MSNNELTDAAWEVLAELQAIADYDIFSVTGSIVTFQDDRGLFSVNASDVSSESLKKAIKYFLLNRVYINCQ